ncbi:MAG: hypothetical protein WBX01_01715 [Nitrososphaeraceae archaeon]
MPNESIFILLSMVAITLVISYVTLITVVNAYGASTYENEDLGIRLDYPSNWTVYPPLINKLSGSGIVLLNPNNSTDEGYFSISRAPSDNVGLTDYLGSLHQQIMKEAEDLGYGLEFVDDNQTSIGKSNNSAWQIQYHELVDPVVNNIREQRGLEISHNDTSLYWITEMNDSFYTFKFRSNIGENFVKYYPDAKSILESVEFIPTSLERIPSFMQLS